ncbi:unnamed protein product [Linum trigynum]|uniref:Histone deacetylase n=1 Tax=Linum trigynum TaxID=586398 RepID=A0AAV2E9M5_9ROSI
MFLHRLRQNLPPLPPGLLPSGHRSSAAVLHRDLRVFNHLQEGISVVPTKALVVMVGQGGYDATGGSDLH